MTQNPMQAVEEIKAHRKQQPDILKEEDEEAHQEEPSSTYWPPQCQEEEPSPQFYVQLYSCLSPNLRQSIFKIEAQEEEPSPIYDHSYSSPHQHYQEEPPPPKGFALEEAMLAFCSQAEESKRSFERMENSRMQSFERMEAHLKQISNIPKEKECQG
jgi:hypothetical protein